jgi:hypothetical protein
VKNSWQPDPKVITRVGADGVFDLRDTRVCAQEVRQAVKQDLPHAALSFG